MYLCYIEKTIKTVEAAKDNKGNVSVSLSLLSNSSFALC
ncbi:hypothetical protein KIS1582_3644 [Cytobacillus firmus]|uniref:Uncharacterized protein n=1 Tax=Cytobacillus firmus TaxID=1399 RepID=A0A800MUB9_CYTFI|nr:hypothetical protein KIS1582_3644 [Cytobacillus firmus]